MATAPRPAAARRMIEAEDDPTLTCLVDGVPHTLRLGELDALTSDHFERSAGRTVEHALMELETSPGLVAVARFLWLCELQRDGIDRARSFAEVAREVNYRTQVEPVSDDSDKAADLGPLDDSGSS